MAIMGKTPSRIKQSWRPVGNVCNSHESEVKGVDGVQIEDKDKTCEDKDKLCVQRVQTECARTSNPHLKNPGESTDGSSKPVLTKALSSRATAAGSSCQPIAGSGPVATFEGTWLSTADGELRGCIVNSRLIWNENHFRTCLKLTKSRSGRSASTLTMIVDGKSHSGVLSGDGRNIRWKDGDRWTRVDESFSLMQVDRTEAAEGNSSTISEVDDNTQQKVSLNVPAIVAEDHVKAYLDWDRYERTMTCFFVMVSNLAMIGVGISMSFLAFLKWASAFRAECQEPIHEEQRSKKMRECES